MSRPITSTAIPARTLKIKALANMTASFESLCLASGMEALAEMMESDAEAACGPRHARDENEGRIASERQDRLPRRQVEIVRPRLRGFDGKELAVASWEAARGEDWLGQWAMNQMLINVSTRKFKRSVRLPEGDVPARKGSGLSNSAVSRHFVALSAARLKEWMASTARASPGLCRKA